MSKHLLFQEGKTEDNVLDKLCLWPVPKGQGSPRGKSQLIPRIEGVLKAALSTESLRVLIMRDVDAGETHASLRQSFVQVFEGLFKQAGLTEKPLFEWHPVHQNVLLMASEKAQIKVALHLADRCPVGSGDQKTMDDYVLELALHKPVADKLFKPKPTWKLTTDDFLALVAETLPKTLEENGRPLVEAKEYSAYYSATLGDYISPPLFAEKVLTHAQKCAPDRVKEVFASLYAAVDFLKS